MLAQALFEILEPAYRPCAHFAGACAGACVWEPSRGLVPCAFGGATGALDEVRLIIVTAEPSDPPDSTGYEGTPQDMLGSALRIFHEAIRTGGIDRAGRRTAFHRNLRRVLDAFWPNDNLETQLRKTWTTNAVLCPAKDPGGRHLARVEQACAQTYLARQLDLFPNAFILALGNKARGRMQAVGLRCDAVGLHPSARKSDADKVASWETAARLFRGEPLGGEASPQSARTQQRTSRQVKTLSRTLRPEVTDDLEAAIMALPPNIADFFHRMIDHSDYDCQAGLMQLMVYFRGAKVGGLNRKISQWYFSKVFVRDHGDPVIMSEHGFKHIVTPNQTHEYWMRQGLGAQAAFEEVMVAMTGVRP